MKRIVITDGTLLKAHRLLITILSICSLKVIKYLLLDVHFATFSILDGGGVNLLRGDLEIYL